MTASFAPHRPDPFFIGDHKALDFLNSVATPWDTEVEWIASGDDLLAWLMSAQLLPQDYMPPKSWKKQALDAVAVEAVGLREWFRAQMTQGKKRGVLEFAPISARLNSILSQSAYHYALARNEQYRAQCQLSCDLHLEKPSDLLTLIALQMADILVHGELLLIHRCANPECTLWFYDRTKGHRRRWCTQSICGNRAKVAAFRKRQSKNS